MPAAAPSSMSITLKIVSIVFYTFIAFICIGLPIAVIPGYVHEQLGFSAVVAGVTIGSQYLATLLQPPHGRAHVRHRRHQTRDRVGAGRDPCEWCADVFATLVDSLPSLSLGILIVARLLLGVAQGLIGVGTISWCMGAVGAEHTARSISWNGIASYGAIAIGAPLGVVMVAEYGYNSLGIALSVLSALGLVLIRNKPSVPVVRGERLPFWAVFGRIAPFGASLCLASIGYGTLTTFITLYYLNRGWAGAAYCLTVFGVCFILSRLVFISAISRFGGFRAAIACMTIETLGLTLLWLAPSTGWH